MGYRLLAVIALTISLIILEMRDNPWLSQFRRGLEYGVEPVVFLAHLPVGVGRWVEESFQTREALETENHRLRNEQLLLSRKVQLMSALVEENKRLRSLLLSSQSVEDHVLIAEVIGVDNDPYRHEIILDRGANDGIAVGLAVIDQKGLMGQVIHVGPFTSRALLITDETHATPVQVVRNGVRAIAVGTGELDKLLLINVPDTADLRVGDELVSSGLGGRFPAGYPVATITYIENDPGQPFAQVEAKPTSFLDRRLLVLIIQSGKRVSF